MQKGIFNNCEIFMHDNYNEFKTLELLLNR